MKSRPIKIAITGPESTGKTTIAQQLAQSFGTVWVKEYARTFLEQLDRSYKEVDLLRIAQEQFRWETEAAQEANKLFFCDTDLVVLKVWSEYKYGRCHPWIEERLKEAGYQLHFLCGTDIPWVYDPLREHPGEREQLFEIYKKELLALGFPYVELEGGKEQRLNRAIEVIKDKFGLSIEEVLI